MAEDHAVVYENGRMRIVALLESPGAADVAPVPACPAWRVADVVAHLTGLAADWVGGNIATYATDAWTAAQVEARRTVPIEAVLDEWQGHGAWIAGALRDPEAHGAPPFMPAVVVTDLISHEHDIRQALNRPGARDDPGTILALASLVGGLRQHVAGRGVASLRVTAVNVRTWDVGRGDASAEVRASAFELVRALTGRRTQEEVRHLDWEGTPDPFLEHWLQFPFSWPATSLDET